ncbi:MAG TPA: TIGR02444 family protein [Caulobacteraceae bacterium]|nr:TIGR02444 family protein [Caulobacteraceae bacterium]
MRLWDRCLRAHSAPDVDADVIELQDEHGQCVSFLLWAAWAAEEGRALEPELFEKAAAFAQDWDARVVQPLRTVRRTLKIPSAEAPDRARETLRDGIKEQEFAAERLMIEVLEAMTGPPGLRPGNIAVALRSASAAWGGSAPRKLLDALAAAFSATANADKTSPEASFSSDLATADQVAIKAKIIELRHAHEQLGDMVVELEQAPMPDQLQVARLKRQKLALRDQITQLEDRLTPDIIA